MKKKRFKIKTNRKIGNELAIGIILILAIAVGTISIVLSKREIAELSEPENNYVAQTPVVKVKKEQKRITSEKKCQSRYYEGESDIYGWADATIQDGEGVIVSIRPEDVKNLPIKDASVLNNFTVRLVDPDAALQKKFNNSSNDNLVKFTVRGYAEICEKEPPQVSIEQATVAFKKS